MPYKDKENLIRWRELNRNHLREYDKKYYQKNKDNEEFKSKKRAISIAYYKKNKKKILKKMNKHLKIKRKKDPEFRLKCLIRERVGKALNKYTKTGKIMSSKLYGIDYKAIIEYLKPLPKDLSKYEIHHTKPLYTFNFINKDGSTNLKEVKKAFAPENHKLMLIEEHKEIHRKFQKLRKLN